MTLRISYANVLILSLWLMIGRVALKLTNFTFTSPSEIYFNV